MLVLGNDYKHPAITAKEAATIDLLCDGRLEFGLGAGWQRTDYDALGLPYDSPGTRIERLGEAVQVIKGAWGAGASISPGSTTRSAAMTACPSRCRSRARRS